MSKQNKLYQPLHDRGPLRVLFANTSMPVGGAETLLVNLVRRLDPDQFEPEIVCLKDAGPLGEMLAREMPVYSRMLTSKYDLRVLGRLRRMIRARRIDAVVTVGAGDKMFWGRLAAWREGVPVILSALHSTGWPDGVGRLNRCLTRITDRFIAVAQQHGRYLAEQGGFPSEKVHVIPNGVDVARFCPNPVARQAVRRDLKLHADVPLFGIVAALRQEKNHLLFLRAAKLVRQAVPDARFLIVGDGPRREQIEVAARGAGLHESVLMLGTRSDIPDLLAALDVFVLPSLVEANPVSILEAMASGLPVIATRVGSVPETVEEGRTGYLAATGDANAIARRCVYLASHPEVAHQLGQNARDAVVRRWSLRQMVKGYERLIRDIYAAKCGVGGTAQCQEPRVDVEEQQQPNRDVEPVA